MKTRTTYFARELWGDFETTVNELGIPPMPWLNKYMMVNPEPDEDGNWTMRPEEFSIRLGQRAEQFPMGTDDYPFLGLDWEDPYIHSAKRIAQMQDLLITATDYFNNKVNVAFYGLPGHATAWMDRNPDYLYQPVIDMQGAIWISVYSNGKDAAWFRHDMAAAGRLLFHTRNMANGRPIIASVMGRRAPRSGWGKPSDAQLEMYFQQLVAGGCDELNVFGDLSYLEKIRDGAASRRWPIDPSNIPTDEEYGAEMANVVRIAHSVAGASW